MSSAWTGLGRHRGASGPWTAVVGLVVLLGLVGCGRLGSYRVPDAGAPNGNGSPDVDALRVKAQGLVIDCDNSVAAGGRRIFDLSPATTPGVTPSWTAEAGAFDDPAGWRTTWTAPQGPGTYLVTVRFTFPDGSSGKVAWELGVVGTGAEATAARGRCDEGGGKGEALYEVARHTDPTTGLTVVLQMPTTQLAHDGRLETSVSFQNDGKADVALPSCAGFGIHVYVRDGANKTLGDEGACEPACDPSQGTVQLKPGDGRGGFPDFVRFGAAKTQCGPVTGFHGLRLTAGDGAYEVVVAVPVVSPKGVGDVQASVPITVGP